MAYDHSDKGFISTEDFLKLPKMSCLECKRIGQNVLFEDPESLNGFTCPQCGSNKVANLTIEFKELEKGFTPKEEKTTQEVFLEQEKKKVKAIKEKPKKKDSEPKRQVKMKKKQEQIGMFK